MYYPEIAILNQTTETMANFLKLKFIMVINIHSELNV